MVYYFHHWLLSSSTCRQRRRHWLWRGQLVAAVLQATIMIVLQATTSTVTATIEISSEWNPSVTGVYVRGVEPEHEHAFAKAAATDDHVDELLSSSSSSSNNLLWLFSRDIGRDGFRWYVGPDIHSDDALAYVDTWSSDVCTTATTNQKNHDQRLKASNWMVYKDNVWQPDSTFHLHCNGYEPGGIDACSSGRNKSSSLPVPCVDLVGSGTSTGVVSMPVVMLGTAHISALHGAGAENPEVVEPPPAIELALDIGYQGLDLGSQLHPAYANEKAVGDLLATNKNKRPRQSVFITTKLSPSEHGFQSTLRAVQRSLRLLRTDTIDLFLIHHPSCLMTDHCEGDWMESWKAMERLLDLGAVRAIGVCNFDYNMLKYLVGDDNNPEQQQEGAARAPVSLVQNRADPLALEDRNVLELCKAFSINYQAFSVLGRQWIVGPWADYWKAPHPILSNPVVVAIANRLSEESNQKAKTSTTTARSNAAAIITPAQVVLRWALQKGWSVVPKTAKAERLESNRQLFHFRLTEADMTVLDNLQAPARGGGEL